MPGGDICAAVQAKQMQMDYFCDGLFGVASAEVDAARRFKMYQAKDDRPVNRYVGST